ncbi:MAG TPA: hypothetical protein VIR29_00765 [Anseongella sp.]
MKKLLITGGFIGMLWAFSCAGDSEESLFDLPDCSTPVSLSSEIMPLLQSNCAIEGCHTAGTGLPDFSLKGNVLEYASEVKRRTAEGSMPPPYSGIELSREEIMMISCWVDQGTLNN